MLSAGQVAKCARLIEGSGQEKPRISNNNRSKITDITTEQRKRAANLISLYVARHLRSAGPRKATQLTPQLAKQIVRLTALKKIQNGLLTYGLKRRLAYRRDGGRKIASSPLGDPPSETDSEVFGSAVNLQAMPIFYPSPAVHFRGRLITTPRSSGGEVLKSLNGPMASLCGVPDTPLRRDKGTMRLIQELLREEEAQGLEVGSGRVGGPLSNPQNSATLPKVAYLPLSMPSATSSPPTRRRRPQRVMRGGSLVAAKSPNPSITTSSASITPVCGLTRPLSDEAELAKLTQQNTRLNAGYQHCDLVYQEIIRDGARPPSPSRHFNIFHAPKRKWSSPARARQVTKQAWGELLEANKTSPKYRCIQWQPDITFIDESVEGLHLELEASRREHERPKPVVKPTSSEAKPTRGKNVKNEVRDRITVQRIMYKAELPPTPPTRKASGAKQKSK